MAQKIQTIFIDDLDGGEAGAKEQGIDIKDRGRVSAAVVEKYRAAAVL